MPHCVLDCSRTIERHADVTELIKVVHDAAATTGLFGPNDVKVRVNLFDHYTVGGTQNDFIHVTASILSGRSVEQRKDLSARIVRALKELLPAVPIISIDVREIERATYHNRFTV
jgi:5-carboxymethyl-2-hydroxymuconate isomerase